MTEKAPNFKSMLLRLTVPKPLVVLYPGMLKRVKRRFKIEQDDQTKKFAMTYDKRRIVEHEWNTLPFGYGLR